MRLSDRTNAKHEEIIDDVLGECILCNKIINFRNWQRHQCTIKICQAKHCVCVCVSLNANKFKYEMLRAHWLVYSLWLFCVLTAHVITMLLARTGRMNEATQHRDEIIKNVERASLNQHLRSCLHLVFARKCHMANSLKFTEAIWREVDRKECNTFQAASTITEIYNVLNAIQVIDFTCRSYSLWVFFFFWCTTIFKRENKRFALFDEKEKNTF